MTMNNVKENTENLTASAADLLAHESSNSSITEDQLDGLTKKQLAGKLTEYLNMESTFSVFAEARLVKSKIDELDKENYDKKLKHYTEDGSPAEEFDLKSDPLDERIKHTWKELNRKRDNLLKEKESDEKENLAAKNVLLEELRELMKGDQNFMTAYNKFHALQNKWRKIGHVPQKEHKALHDNFYFLTGKFYELIKLNQELRELDRKKNDELRLQFCEKAEQLVNEPSLRNALAALGPLQKEWSEIKNFSRDLNETLWPRFKAAGDKIIERKKEHLRQQQEQQEKNLAAKISLCEKLEQTANAEISSHRICQEIIRNENDLWEAWQKIGFVPKSDNGACWKRFKKTRHQLHRAIDAYYSRQRGEFASNLEKKTQLCLQAEELQNSTDWTLTADKLKKLQQEWKGTGPVAPKVSDAIWKRFRAACDTFFTNKTNAQAEKNNALKANVNFREQIIAKTDAAMPATDAAQSMQFLKSVQEEWSKAGEVSANDLERLGHNFALAIEKFLHRMKENHQLEEKQFYRFKYEQLLKSADGKEQIRREQKALKDKLKRLESEKMQLENNLGFFSKSKNASPLIAEYRQKLENTIKESEQIAYKLKFIPAVY